MYTEMTVIYIAGEIELPLATLRRAEDRIEYRLYKDSSAVPFGSEELVDIISRLIELPLRVSQLRHKTMPQWFDEIERGSEEHFALLERSCGPFRVVAK